MANILERIMYIDDNETERMIVRAIFDQNPRLTTMCCNGCEEAISVINEFKPHLILLDLVMPNIDGLETLTKIRQMKGFEKTPVIFLTAEEKVKMLDQYKNLGVLGVMHKPVKPNSLTSEVATFWSQYARKIA